MAVQKLKHFSFVLQFGTDDENVQSLISMAKCLDLTRYTELRREAVSDTAKEIYKT
jgi:hypothetical protein